MGKTARPVRTLALLFSLWSVLAAGQQPPSHAKDNATRFAVIGDSGTGGRNQYEVAEQLVKAFQETPFEFVLMMGDNLYGGERPQDFVQKFEKPYKPLLDAKVDFYACLGNHDDPNQRFYKPFNMNGERYYTFKKGFVRFFALDSNYMDREQTAWVEKELKASSDAWKIAFFHHPLYSSGERHGSEMDLREELEPLFVKHGVRVVFSGHEHFYERIKSQKGVYYFISGAAGKLRRGNIGKTEMTAAGFDTDNSFMLIEVDGDALAFRSISRLGKVVDQGTVPRTGTEGQTAAPQAAMRAGVGR